MTYLRALENQIRAADRSMPNDGSGGSSAAEALPTLDAPVAILRRAREQGEPIPTGIKDLDERLRGGMRPGKSLIIGGTPHAGKTSLALQMCRTGAETGCAVACLMADEGREPAVIRLGQQLGYIREQIEEGLDGVLAGMERDLSHLVLTFPDPDAEADTSIEGIAEALVKAHPDRRKLLLLDSIQTVRTRLEAPSIRERIMANARTARQLAVEHGLIVIATSEAPRAWYRSQREEDRASDLAAFAEGRIEYSADVLLLLRASKEDPDLVDVRIPKNRLGTRFPMLLRLDHDRARFEAVEGNPIQAAREAAEARKVDEAKAAILRELQANSDGLTWGQLKELVRFKASVFCEAVKRLRVAGIIVARTHGRSTRYHLADVPKR